jgi:hypothetical protein
MLGDITRIIFQNLECCRKDQEIAKQNITRKEHRSLTTKLHDVKQETLACLLCPEIQIESEKQIPSHYQR